MDPFPNLEYERQLIAEGVTVIAGVDEVGRGAVAGPIMAAAVILPPIAEIERDAEFWLTVNDSKVVSARKRAAIADGIRARTAAVSVAKVEADVLDDVGLTAANRIVMELAVDGLPVEPQMLLIDALTIDSGIWQIGIIDGDAISMAIAAASIVAKVERDALMTAYDAVYPEYGFAAHKGYGTSRHVAAIAERGVCPLHRRSFAPVRIAIARGPAPDAT